MMNFFKDESGQGMVEYGLIIALVAIAAIFGLGKLAPKINELFEEAATALEGEGGGEG